MIVFETIHALKGKIRNKAEMTLKIDINLLYNGFRLLKCVHNHISFAERWIHWAMMCMTLVHFSILLNANSVEPIHLGRGLRQEDSLSPYLFILVVEGLSDLIHKVVSRGDIYGV